MTKQEFDKKAEVLEFRQRIINKYKKELQEKTKELYLEYTKDFDTNEIGDVLGDVSGFMVLDRKDYVLSHITGLPIVLHYGTKCNKKGVIHACKHRITMASGNIK